METLTNLSFSLQEVMSAFVILFAVIDITGSVPIILDLQEKTGGEIKPGKAVAYSFIIFISFLFGGNAVLSLFGVDISSFAVAGGLVLFVMAAEMTFGIEVFKFDGPSGTVTLVPLVFPLIAGAASFTTLLSLRAEYNLLNILIALMLNLLIIFFVIKYVYVVERMIGKGGIYILRKFFGIVLLAMAVKLFTSNLTNLIDSFHK